MESLTQTLAVQHRAVEKLVEEIEAAVARKDPRAIRALLEKLGTALVAHLQLEDRRLYPELQRLAQAQQQQSLIAIASNFSSSMASISVVLTRFLERYQKADWQLEKFTGEWKTIATTLGARIKTEETSLYPLYDRLTGARPGTLFPK